MFYSQTKKAEIVKFNHFKSAMNQSIFGNGFFEFSRIHKKFNSSVLNYQSEFNSI